MRNFVLWLVLFVAGLLLGFVPQFLKAHELRKELDTCNASLQLAHIQQSAALTYVSATQLNYGLASGYGNRFFDQAQQLAGTTSDPSVRSMLTDVLSLRERITSDLSKGNSQVVSALQALVLKVESFP